MTTSTSTSTKSFWQRHWQKLLAAGFWVLLVGGYLWYSWRNQLSPAAAVGQLIELLKSDVGVLIYIGVYLLRPLIFFPATFLTLAGGSVFGSVWGLIYTVIGANGSALVAYTIGRFFGQPEQNQNQTGIVNGYIERLRRNSFETIMLMRLIFLPYDLVNYLAGILRINWKQFLLATMLGSFPGTLTFVLFGASFEGDFAKAEFSFNPWAFAGSVVIFIISIAISRWLKRREAAKPAA